MLPRLEWAEAINKPAGRDEQIETTHAGCWLEVWQQGGGAWWHWQVVLPDAPATDWPHGETIAQEASQCAAEKALADWLRRALAMLQPNGQGPEKRDWMKAMEARQFNGNDDETQPLGSAREP